MSREYSLSDLADQDVLDICAHLARYGVDVADRFVDRLAQVFEQLVDFPGMGRARSELREGLRSFPLGDYIIFYVPTTDGIRIVRVLHGRLDPDIELR